MKQVTAASALLADGWADNVRLTVGEGRIAGIETGLPAGAGGVLLPGLCNAHSHAFQRALAGRTERRGPGSKDTFWTWRTLMYTLAERVGPAELAAVARQVYVEMVASGYTSVVEFHYLHRASATCAPSLDMLEALLEAATDSGIRLTYVPILYERGDFDDHELAAQQKGFGLSLDDYLAHYQEAAQRIGAPHGVGLGAHSLRAVSPASLEILAAQAEADDVPMHLHIAEQQREVERCIEVYGARPVRWLLDRFAVDRRWTLVHATHLDDEELRLLAESGAVACLCPSTEGNLGDGFFRLKEYLAGDGAFAIGSDSHVSINPYEELRWLDYGQRLNLGQRNVAAQAGSGAGERLYLAALEGGEHAAGRISTGLAEGSIADLVVIDDQHPAVLGHGTETLLDAIVFSGLPSPIAEVFVHGERMVSGGKHAAAAGAAANYARALQSLNLGESTR